MLPLKLALDRVYVRRACFRYDMSIMARTAGVILASLAGRKNFANPPEINAAWQLLVPARPPRRRGPAAPQRAGRDARHGSDERRAGHMIMTTTTAVAVREASRPRWTAGTTWYADSTITA